VPKKKLYRQQPNFLKLRGVQRSGGHAFKKFVRLARPSGVGLGRGGSVRSSVRVGLACPLTCRWTWGWPWGQRREQRPHCPYEVPVHEKAAAPLRLRAPPRPSGPQTAVAAAGWHSDAQTHPTPVLPDRRSSYMEVVAGLRVVRDERLSTRPLPEYRFPATMAEVVTSQAGACEGAKQRLFATDAVPSVVPSENLRRWLFGAGWLPRTCSVSPAAAARRL